MALSLTAIRPMVRAFSVFLTDKDDATIDAIVEDHAIPRIRMLMLTATGSDGRHVFYTALPEVADGALTAVIEGLIDDIFSEATVVGGLQRIAAALAAALLLTGDVSIIESQQRFAASIEKSALADLDRLVRSPLMKSTVTALASSVTASKGIDKAIYMALDGDVDEMDLDARTVTPYVGAQLPFVGATNAGRATLNINGYQVTVQVAAGEKPATTLNKLMLGFEALPGSGKPPLVFGISEKQRYQGTVQMDYTDPLSGLPDKGDFSINTEGGSLTVMPGQYDATRDVIAATIYLEHQSDPGDLTKYEPGIIGYVYGIVDSVRSLTRNGPHSFAADLSQGRSLSLSSTSSESIPLSDSFFFQVSDAGGVLATGGNLVYTVNGSDPVTVPISTGADATSIANSMAQSLAASVNNHGVFGAVRPSAKITPQGTVLEAPSLELIAWRLETAVAAFVVTLQSVPTGSVFAVVAPNVATAPLFDRRTKSVVVKTELNKRASSAGTSTPITPDGQTGQAFLFPYQKTEALSTLLTKFKKGR